MTELQIYINKALGLLLNSSPPLLTLENGEQLKRELVAVVEQLESPQFDYSKESFLQQALQISGSSVAVISDVAKRLFSQQQYDDALALYSLLSTLDPGNADCWFQLGMCAQESEKWDLAIRAYGAVIQLAPEFIGAYLFSIECHLKGNDQQAANETWKKAKQIAAANDLPDEWREAYNLYATAFEMLEKQ
jgi:tetratricopeptide (TPR) repeat protein